MESGKHSESEAGASSQQTQQKTHGQSQPSFKDLGVCDTLCDACKELKWDTPTPIQAEALPPALKGQDIIGLAETGSGKTAAFALPILQDLLDNPRRMFACVLAPTRELAFQISEQFDALGKGIGLKCAVIVGGVDMVTQAVALAKKPHIIIGTPGRLVDHLENTKGFSLSTIQHLVLDEADRMLSMDFEEAINTILNYIPKKRHTYLFSATMTSKVAKLQRASLHDPVKLEVNSKYSTVSTLVQNYVFIPAKYKDCYLAYLLNEFVGQTVLVFVATCATAQKLKYMMANLGFNIGTLHGQMSQSKRLGSLNKFKSGEKYTLVATDVASRGLDIPSVDVVINYDVPTNGKDYIHRVGRTARAGKSGRAITCVTQYDIELYQRIEKLIGKKLDAYDCEESSVLLLLERVTEAQRIASLKLREEESKYGKKGKKGKGAKDASLDESLDDPAAASALIEESKRKRSNLSKSISRKKQKTA